MISVNMKYCAVIRNDDGSIDKVIDQDGVESQLFNTIAKHPLIKSKEAALDIFKNKFSKVIESKADKTQGFFGDVVTGRSEKFRPAVPYTYTSSFNDKQEAFRQHYDTHKGKFDEHIATSIPMFRDTQVKKGAAIVATVGQGTMIDIGGSEGGFAKAVTQTSNGAIKTINLEPQEDMVKAHNRTAVEGAIVVSQPFLTPFDERAPYKPNKKVEAVHESMVFQFIAQEREAFVKEVKDTYLTEDGIFITEEKFQTNEADYKKNEDIKNTLHKSKYYTQEQLDMKAEGVLVGMKKNQAYLTDYVKILKDNFKYVQIYWSSGNFKGIIATDSKEKFDTFMAAIGDTSSEFSTNERVTDGGKITRKPVMERAKPGSVETRDANWDRKTKESLPTSTFKDEAAVSTAIETKPFGLATAENPLGQQVSDAENTKNNRAAKEWLIQRGYKPQVIFGKYGVSEKSFYVPGLTMEDAIVFANEFDQETVATDKGLVYQDGSYNPRIGQEVGIESPEDFYSTIKTKEGLVNFSVEYDLNTKLTFTGKTTTRVNKSLIDLQKPNISFIFADDSTLIESEDARENRNIQDQLKEEADDLQNLVNCLWG
jgi:hypothetical protein